jgi:hypothetical protein
MLTVDARFSMQMAKQPEDGEISLLIILLSEILTRSPVF